MAREYILVNYYLCSIYLWVLCGDGMKVLDLFSGIGGFSLGLERAGMETVAFCEIEDFPRKVLAKHWPGVPIYDDVRKLDGKQFRGTVDVVCGGFPCQDVSVAGKGKGFGGERTSLYAEMLRIIGECQPGYAIFENVTGLLSGEQGRWFAKFLYDLAEIGYDAEWHCISASELGANHHRDRVWIISYPKYDGQPASEVRESNQERDGSDQEGQKSASETARPGNAEILGNTEKLQRNVGNDNGKDSQRKISEPGDTGCENDMANTKSQQDRRREREGIQRHTGGKGKQVLPNAISKRQPRQRQPIKPLLAEAIKNWQTINAESGCISGVWSTEPELGRVANGVPDRTHRLKGLGNAVVPQIPELIGRAIMEIEAKRLSSQAQESRAQSKS